MDKIIIEDILARCVIGVTDEERREKQDVLVSVVLWTDLRPVGRSDRVEDIVDYRFIKKRIVSLVEGSQYRLVEALAERVAELCLENPRVDEVQVTVEKPGALRFARRVAVEIARDRTDCKFNDR